MRSLVIIIVQTITICDIPNAGYNSYIAVVAPHYSIEVIIRSLSNLRILFMHRLGLSLLSEIRAIISLRVFSEIIDHISDRIKAINDSPMLREILIFLLCLSFYN